MKSLIYCRTPLQAVLLKQIIKQDPGKYFIIYHPTSTSPKHKAYFESLSISGIFLEFKEKRLRQIVSDIFAYISARRAIGRQHFDRLLLASFDSMVAGLLTLHTISRYELFDDGSMSVNHEAFNSRLKPENRLWRTIRRIARIPSPRQIVEQSVAHHTIFPAEKVFTSPSQYRHLPLLFGEPATKHGGRRISIMLGTTIDLPFRANETLTADEKANRKHRYETFLANARAEIFLPHPAENRMPFVTANLPRSAEIAGWAERLIIEDLIQKLRDLGFEPDIYGFASSALLTLAGSASVTNVIFPGVSDSLTETFADFGIPSLTFDEAAARIRNISENPFCYE